MFQNQLHRQLALEPLEDRNLLAVVTVDTTGDVLDAPDTTSIAALINNPGSDGFISLREAVIAANTQMGDDQILFSGSGTYTLTRIGLGEDLSRDGDLDITDTTGALKITGNGSGSTIIDGNGAVTGDRVFDVLSGATLDLSGVTVRDGRATNGAGIRNSGRLMVTDSVIGTMSEPNIATGNGGGIYDAGTMLMITSSTIQHNQATDGGGVWTNNSNPVTITGSTIVGNTASDEGGGIYNAGRLTVTDSTIGTMAAPNVASIYGGGIYNAGTLTVGDSSIAWNTAGSYGGGIENALSAVATFTNSTISSNTASFGGGGINNDGSLAVTSSTVSGNTADFGAGIYNTSSSAVLNVTTSTISGNMAGTHGGGIDVLFGTATVTNSTVSANTAAESGGGIYVHSTSTLTATNVTITQNHSDNDDSGAEPGGGIFIVSGGNVTLNNTIVAENFRGSATTTLDDIEGALKTGSMNNLIGFDSGVPGTGDVTGLAPAMGNKVGRPVVVGDPTSGPIDPLLGPLQDNGGPTMTHALRKGSPAIDMGNDMKAMGLTRDQRGVGYPRFLDGDGDGVMTVDIGAYELAPPDNNDTQAKATDLGYVVHTMLPEMAPAQLPPHSPLPGTYPTISPEGDIDWYKMTSWATGEFEIIIDIVDNSGHVMAEIFDAAGNVLDSGSTFSSGFLELYADVIKGEMLWLRIMDDMQDTQTDTAVYMVDIISHDIYDADQPNNEPSLRTDLGMIIHDVETELTVPWGDYDWYKFTTWAQHGDVSISLDLVDRNMDGVLDPDETLVMELWQDTGGGLDGGPDGSLDPAYDTLVSLGRVDATDFSVRIENYPAEKNEMFWLLIAGDPNAMSYNEYDLDIVNDDTFDRERSGLWVVDSISSPLSGGLVGNIYEIDPDDGHVLTTLPVPEPVSGKFDGLAVDFLRDNNGKIVRDFLYYINGEGLDGDVNEQIVYTLDPWSGKILNAWGSPIGSRIDALAVDSANGELYLADYATDTIYVQDVSAPLFGTGAGLRSFAVSANLYGGLGFNATTGRLFATVDGLGSKVAIINPATGAVEQVYAAPAPLEWGVAVLDDRLFTVSKQGLVYELNPANGNVLNSFSSPSGSSSIVDGPSAADGASEDIGVDRNDTIETATDFGMIVHVHEPELTIPWGDEDWFKVTTWADDGSVDVRVTLVDRNGNWFIDPDELLHVELYSDGLPGDPSDDDGTFENLAGVGKLQGFDVVIAHVPAQKNEMFMVHVEGEKTTGRNDDTVLVVERDNAITVPELADWGPGFQPGGRVVRLDKDGGLVQVIDYPVFDTGVISDIEIGPNDEIFVSMDVITVDQQVGGIADGVGQRGQLVQFDVNGNLIGIIPFTNQDGTPLLDNNASFPTTPNAFFSPFGFDVAQDGTFWVALPNSNQVAHLGSMGKVIELYPVMMVPEEVAFNEEDGLVYIGYRDTKSGGSAKVDVLNPATGGLTTIIGIPAGDPAVQGVLGLNFNMAGNFWMSQHLSDPSVISEHNTNGDLQNFRMPTDRPIDPEEDWQGNVWTTYWNTESGSLSTNNDDIRGVNRFSPSDMMPDLTIDFTDNDPEKRFGGFPVGLAIASHTIMGYNEYTLSISNNDRFEHNDFFPGYPTTSSLGPQLMDVAGKLIVMDDGTEDILAVDPQTGAWEVLIERQATINATGNLSPNFDDAGLAFDHSSNLYYTDGLNVLVWHGGLPRLLTSSDQIDALLDFSFETNNLTFASDGFVYLVVEEGHDGDSAVLKIDPLTGVPSVYIPGDILGGIFDTCAEGVHAADGELYVATACSPDLLFAQDLSVAPSATSFRFLGGDDPYMNPQYMTIAPNGDLIVQDEHTDAIYRVNRTTGAVSIFLTEVQAENVMGINSLSFDGGIEFDQDGNFYVVADRVSFAPSGSGGVLLKFNPTLTSGVILKRLDSGEGDVTIAPLKFFPGNAVGDGVPSAGNFPVNVSTDPSEDQMTMEAAVNPLDVDHVVIATTSVYSMEQSSNVDVYWSMDGGHTWMQTRIDDTVDGALVGSSWLMATPVSREDPSVVFDRLGNVYVSYRLTDSAGVDWILLARSTDGGASFSEVHAVAIGAPPVAPSLTPELQLDNPRLAIGPDYDDPAQDNVYVSYTRIDHVLATTEIYLSGSHATDGRVTRTLGTNAQIQRVSNSVSGIPDFSIPAVGPTGNVVVAWVNTTSGNVMIDNDPDGRNTSNIDAGFSIFDEFVVNALITGGSPSFVDRVSLDVDRSGGDFNGRTYLAYTDNTLAGDTDVFVLYSDNVNNPLPATWHSPASRPWMSADFESDPQLEVDQVTGDVNLVWYATDVIDSSSNYVKAVTSRTTDGGLTWGNQFTLSHARSHFAGPLNAAEFYFGDYIGVASQNGTAYFAWSDNSVHESDKDVFFNAIHPPTDLGTLTMAIWEDELTIPWFDEDWFVFEVGDTDWGIPDQLKIVLDLEDTDMNMLLDGHEKLVVDVYYDADGVDDPHDPNDFQRLTATDFFYLGDEVGEELTADGQFRLKAFFDTSAIPAGDRIYVRVFGGPLWNDTSEMGANEYDLHIIPAFSIDPDPYEPNDSIQHAYDLGSETEIILPDLTIHATAPSVTNDDWFKVTAHLTGKLTINAMFVDNAKLGMGNLDVEVWKYNDQGMAMVIDSSTTTTDNEMFAIPVVEAEDYYIHVYSVTDPMTGHKFPNAYTLEIENFVAPAPTLVFLNPADPSGSGNSTSDSTPKLFIQASLSSFEAMGIALDGAIGTAGADVKVELSGIATGTTVTANAARMGTSSLWMVEVSPGLPNDTYLVNGFVLITDGKGVQGMSPSSPPLLLTVNATTIQGTVFEDINSNLRQDDVPRDPNVVMIVDNSDSTNLPFGTGTVFSGIIDSLRALNAELVAGIVDGSLDPDTGVSIITFWDSASILDMDPVAAGVQLSAAPGPDVDAILMSLAPDPRTGVIPTNFTPPLASANNVCTLLNTTGTPGNLSECVVVFVTDGLAVDSGTFPAEAQMLLDDGATVRAIGVGPSADLNQLRLMDPGALLFDDPSELPALIDEVSKLPESFVEPGLPDEIVFLDNNNNGMFDSGDVPLSTNPDGTYSFVGLGPGTYNVCVEVPPGATATTPSCVAGLVLNAGDTAHVDFGLASAPVMGAKPQDVVVRIDLLASNGGVPGDLITNDTVILGQEFFVAITVEDTRDTPQGVISLAVDLAWASAVLEEVDSLSPANDARALVTSAFPLSRFGTLSNAAGTIDELRGGALPNAGAGSAIGLGTPGRFALLRFRADQQVTNMPFGLAIGSGGFAVADGVMVSIEVESQTLSVITAPTLIVTDSSGAANDLSLQFTTALSQFRAGATDSTLVRPAYPDDQQFIDVTNNGSSPLTLFEIQINAPDVSVSPPLTSSAGDDLVLSPGQTQRFALTYAPSLPSLADATVQTFSLANGLVLLSNAGSTPSIGVALLGSSTFNGDINYDGSVSLGDLGPFNANFGRSVGDANFDPTSDVNGDGTVNLGDLGPINAEFGRSRPLPLLANRGAVEPNDQTRGVTQDELASVTEIAIGYWESTRPDAAAALQNIELHVANLDGGILGLAQGNVVWIDENAAGHGWRVDPYAASNSAADGQLDLLSVITHELGHLLGLPDLPAGSSSSSVMTSTLAPSASSMSLLDSPRAELFSGNSTARGQGIKVPRDRVFADLDGLFLMLDRHDLLPSQVADVASRTRSDRSALLSDELQTGTARHRLQLRDAERGLGEQRDWQHDALDDFFADLDESLDDVSDEAL